MEKATEFVKILSQVSAQISLTLFLLGLTLIFTVNVTNSLMIWDQSIPLINLPWRTVFLFIAIISLLLFPVSLLIDWIKIRWFRCQYPIKNLEKNYFIVDVKGNVFLLDMDRKEIKWIENWQTLSDLHFNGYLLVLFPHSERESHWSNYTSDEIEAKAREKLTEKLKGSNYKFGGGIRTRGVPGT